MSWNQNLVFIEHWEHSKMSKNMYFGEKEAPNQLKKPVFSRFDHYTIKMLHIWCQILIWNKNLHKKSVSDHFCSIILTDFITHFEIQKLCLKMSNQTDVPYEPQCAIKGLVMTQNDWKHPIKWYWGQKTPNCRVSICNSRKV